MTVTDSRYLQTSFRDTGEATPFSTSAFAQTLRDEKPSSEGELECRIGSCVYKAVLADPPRDGPRKRKSTASNAHDVLTLNGRTYILVLQKSLPPASSEVLQQLTGRELEIAHRIGAGKSDKYIAFELGISEYTVREHVRRIFHKLKVSKRAALVRAMYCSSGTM